MRSGSSGVKTWQRLSRESTNWRLNCWTWLNDAGRKVQTTRSTWCLAKTSMKTMGTRSRESRDLGTSWTSATRASRSKEARPHRQKRKSSGNSKSSKLPSALAISRRARRTRNMSCFLKTKLILWKATWWKVLYCRNAKNLWRKVNADLQAPQGQDLHLTHRDDHQVVTVRKSCYKLRNSSHLLRRSGLTSRLRESPYPCSIWETIYWQRLETIKCWSLLERPALVKRHKCLSIYTRLGTLSLVKLGSRSLEESLRCRWRLGLPKRLVANWGTKLVTVLGLKTALQTALS